jgi:hypothetical protein
LQWNLTAPGVLGAVNVALFPGSTDTSKPPASAVTVCFVVSLFDTVTVLPALAVVAENAKFAIVMVAPPLPLLAAPLLPLLLHAESATARAATARRTLTRRERERCMAESTESIAVRFTERTVRPVLPRWMDADFLRGATTGAVIGLAAAGLIVLVIVRGIISKVIVLGLIAALAVGALTYRTSLEHCLKTCSCRIGTVRIPIHDQRCASKH